MPNDTAQRVGDEPLQFKRKFPEITVAVDEDRVDGVSRLIKTGHDIIVLDDAYQHRALRPGLAVLLFDYHAMGKPKWLLPAGDYRDAFGARRRADVMVVTKAPAYRSEEHTSELQSLMRISYAVFCLKKKTQKNIITTNTCQNPNSKSEHIIKLSQIEH